MLSKLAMLVNESFELLSIFLTQCRNVTSICILPRSGGPFLKKSAAYPKRFGQSVCRNHRRFLDDTCLMLKGFSSWKSFFKPSKQIKTTSPIRGIGSSYSFFHKNIRFCRYGDILHLQYLNRSYKQNLETIWVSSLTIL